MQTRKFFERHRLHSYWKDSYMMALDLYAKLNQVVPPYLPYALALPFSLKSCNHSMHTKKCLKGAGSISNSTATWWDLIGMLLDYAFSTQPSNGPTFAQYFSSMKTQKNKDKHYLLVSVLIILFQVER